MVDYQLIQRTDMYAATTTKKSQMVDVVVGFTTITNDFYVLPMLPTSFSCVGRVGF
jgi:hypothetical protein